jgi:cystathionine beta-lyase
MDFDQIIDRVGTHSSKWDSMEAAYGVSPKDGIAMWVADMDFRPPACAQRALQKMLDHGIYGYFGEEGEYRAAIQWWMRNRHDWEIDPTHVFTTHGLVNGVSMCLDSFSKVGDHIVLTTPVYHAFARVIHASERHVTVCPLARVNGRYEMDFAAWDAAMTGKETMFILCSPHNPGGRVWSQAELRGVADFCKRHDLILISDEIHHDLVMPGHKHIPMTLAAPDIADRLVMLTASTKTFNVAGAHLGNVIIADEALRARFARRMNAMGNSPGSFGLHMVTALYSPEGAEWVDAACAYIARNAAIFDAGMKAIPGVRSMALEATYLAWVDFEDLGMEPAEVISRIQTGAKIAANHGVSFGKGGERYMRFNLATPRATVIEAVERMQKAFADLQ